MDKVLIFDTTLRDGEQSPGFSLTSEQKLEFAKQLERLNVDVIEAGFPAASPDDFAAVQQIAREIKGRIVTGLARAVPEDVDCLWEAVKVAENPRIHTFISTSDIHLEKQFRLTREQAKERAVAMVARAKSYCSDVEFSPMDATRSDWTYLYEVIEAVIEAGATTINVADTCGYIMPDEFGEIIAGVWGNVRNADKATISVHCHDDLGMAVANSLAAIKAGARQVEGCINGIGERAGNAALEEVVMALTVRKDMYGVDVNVNTAELYPTSQMLSAFTDSPVQRNKAIVGANAFAHEAGIHQDGMLKNRETYEIMVPEDVGWEGTKLVLGKHSGRAGFRNALKDLGLKVPDDQIDGVYGRFLELADRKKNVTGADIAALVSDELSVASGLLQLVRWNASIGSGGAATASVVIERDGVEFSGDAEGNGPVNALYGAIDAVVPSDNELTYYHVEAVTPGEDAQGQVHVRIKVDGQIYTGHGLATDIVEASARAYLAALSQFTEHRPDTVLMGSSTSRWS